MKVRLVDHVPAGILCLGCGSGGALPGVTSLLCPQIEEALVRRKKMELLQKYASETLQAQSEEAKRLLGY